MPAIGELGALPVILSDSLLAKTPLWKREVRTVTPTDLIAFVAMYRGSSRYFDALAETDTLIKAGIEALESGQVEKADFVGFEPPEQPYLLSDLNASLSKLSIARRRAVLFALEMQMSPREVIELTWKNLRMHSLTTLAHQVVSAMPRHIRLGYVFWEDLPNGSAGPLFGLAESIRESFDGSGFEMLLRKYERMVMIDADAVFESFTKAINAEVDDRISG